MTLATNRGNHGETMPSGPSDSQLFGGLAIYKHYERSKRLARDLEAAFLPSDYHHNHTKFPDALREPLGVLFVARDGMTEDTDEEGRSKNRKFLRYYHPSFIEQFAFNSKTSLNEQKSLDDWIINAAATLEEPVIFSATEIRLVLNELLPLETGCSKSRQEHLTAKDAFECLVEAYSHQRYTGGTPAVLDAAMFESGGNKVSIFSIPWSQTHNDDGTPNPLVTLRSLRMVDGSWHEHNEGQPIKADQFDLATAAELDEGQLEIAKRFFTFSDTFFRGTRQRLGVEKSFHGLVLPLYDRWETTEPCGGFLGWIFLHIPGEELRNYLEACLCHSDPEKRLLYREVLRANLNDFADSVSEHLMNEELKSFASSSRSPMEFFRSRFHHIEGWIAATGVKDTLDEWEFHRYENRYLTVRLDEKTCVTLAPKTDCIISEDPPVEYTQRVTLWARTLWESLHQLVEQRDQGRIGEWATFGHEMKHVAAALSGRWFVPPGQGGEILGHAIAPVPELIAGAGSMIYLWCPAGDVREMLPHWNPKASLLSQTLERIWDIALYGILASLAKTKRLSNAESVMEVSLIVEKAKEIWKFQEWWIINADPTALNNPTSPVLQKILRAFSIVSNNLIRHASISDSLRSCSFTVSKNDEILIETDTAYEHREAGVIYTNSLSEHFPSLNNVRSGTGSTKSQGLGKKILVNIIESELSGKYEELPGDRHRVRIVVPSDVLPKGS